MTWAQSTFAFCFGVIVPTAGFLCGIAVKRDGRPALKGFALGAGAALLGFVACCFVAHFSFPKYPSRPISEVVANAFTLPFIGSAVFVVWFVSRRSSKRFRWTASALLILLYLTGLFLSYRFVTWGFRKALPYAASDIHEASWEDSLLPDYGYQLKAKITEDDFRRYIGEFGLTPHTPGRTYSDYAGCLAWGADPMLRTEWFDPSPSLDSTYVWQGNRTWIFAKYEGGYLYLESLRH